jgi:DNA-binding transcriptional MocR family regulator
MDRAINGQFDHNGLIGLLGTWSAAEGPLYRRLAAALQATIERGDLPAGARLPPERDLARQLQVSRTTVVAAYNELEEAQLIARRQGSGTRVQPRPTASQTSTPELAREFGRNPLFRGLLDRPETALDMVGAYLLGPGGLPRQVLDGIDGELAALGQTAGYWPLGYPPLRAAIAEYLSRRGLATSPDQVLVTSGAQQAIHLVAWLYLDRGEAVIVENPTYAGALDAFNGQGAHVLGAPTNRNGVDVDQLAALATRLSPRLIYIIPTYQNPVGGLLPSAARQALANLVSERGLVLLEDDSLAGLGFGGTEPPPVAAYAPSRATNVLTVGSLSKVCWGGLRVGWVRGAESTIAQLGRVKAVADLGSAVPSQVIATRVMSCLDVIRRDRLRLVTERLGLLTRLLQRWLPDWTWDQPRGGLCLWVRLPRGNAVDFAQVALRHGVSVVPGPVASTDGSFYDYLRLPFGQPPAVLEEAVRRLGRAWQAYAAVGELRSESLAVVV